MSDAEPVRLAMVSDVLLIDDGAGVADEVSPLLDALGCRISARCNTEAFRAEHAAHIDLIVTALGRPHKAASVLSDVRRGRPDRPIIAFVTEAVAAATLPSIASTADDFVVAPFRCEELGVRLGRLARGTALLSVSEHLSAEFGLRNLVGQDPGFRRIVEQIPRIAASDANVLISGETGTGKELFARAIHHSSPRRSFPFVAVDCGAFPEHLLENELFGHVKGAFTDARTQHRGLASMAEGGVLFLDEVDALSLILQSKLMRFLQERVFKPLGAEQFRRANVRVLAASNRNLEQLSAQGKFRSDLYFRLNIVPLHLMPLRERAADIELLALRFLEEFNRSTGAPPKRLSKRAMRGLKAHDWPGNVRELSNVLQRATVLVERPEIDVDDLSLPRRAGPPPELVVSRSFREAKAHAVAAFERDFLASLLEKHAYNISQASREAGKDRRAFGRLVKKHGLLPLVNRA